MKLKLFVAAGACALTFVVAGCYTQLTRPEPSESRYVEQEENYSSPADTTDGTTVNNYYFSDDAYRHSRFQASFGYYYPYQWGYTSGIYNPWLDDPWYWSDGWRSNILWPYPTWNPYGGYYGCQYWGYYNHHNYNHGYYGG